MKFYSKLIDLTLAPTLNISLITTSNLFYGLNMWYFVRFQMSNFADSYWFMFDSKRLTYTQFQLTTQQL